MSLFEAVLMKETGPWLETNIFTWGRTRQPQNECKQEAPGDLT
jgi:hypothetical protein